MGNTESSCSYLNSLHLVQDQLRSTLNVAESSGGGSSSTVASAATTAVFSTKVDYIDPSLQSLLPPSASSVRGLAGGNAAGASGSNSSGGSTAQQQAATHQQQQQPHVTCLMTSSGMWGSRRAALERAAHTSRMTTHPNIFRCVKSNENATKQFTIIGAPQLEWLVPPSATAESASTNISAWSASEAIVGVAGIVDAVATLLSTQSTSVLTSLRLHQISVAVHRGASASVKIDDATLGRGGFLDASYVHAGRWILHDLTTVEPQPKSGDRVPVGVTLRSVALFVLEVLGFLGRNPSLRSEVFDIVRRSVIPRGSAYHAASASSNDDASADASPQRRQLSTGGTPGELGGDVTLSNASMDAHAARMTPPASPTPQGSASATLVAMRTVESIFSIVMEDIRLVVDKSHHSNNNSMVAGAGGGSFGAISGTDEGIIGGGGAGDNASSTNSNSSPPSRSSATPVHLDQAPTFAAAASEQHEDTASTTTTTTTTTGVERLLQWIHYAVMDSVHHAPYLQGGDVIRLLTELRDILMIDLNDPIATLLRHGQGLYLYSADDEHRRGRGAGASKKLDAYDDMCHATYVIRRDFMSSNHLGLSGAHAGQASPQSTVWERRILRWLLHPSHAAQPESYSLLEHIFSTIGSPTALISRAVLEVVAVDWLTEVRNPTCRAAALRYGNVLFSALPPDRLGGLLTTAGYVFMQGRTCLTRCLEKPRSGSSASHQPILSPANVTIALTCARAFVEATPCLAEELLCSHYLDSVDRNMNRFLLQHVLLKELALLLRACAVVDDTTMLEVYGNKAHQAVTKLLKQILQTFAVLATPCLQRLAAHDYRSSLQDVLPSAMWFVASCGYGVYYGTTESRERVFSILSALLLHGHVHPAGGATATSADLVASGLPVSNAIIMRWWLPMVTPLCGCSDTRLRLAASHVAGALTKLLVVSPPPQPTAAVAAPPNNALIQALANALASASATNGKDDDNVDSDSDDGVEDAAPQPAAPTTSSNGKLPRQDGGGAQRSQSGPCTLMMFQDVYRMQDEDLQRSHGDELRPPATAGDAVANAAALSVDAMVQRYVQQYQKTTYAVCFTEAVAARNGKDNSTIRPAAATHPSGGKAAGVPTKDFLTSIDGRLALFYCLGGRVDHDDTLLPQSYY